MFFCIQFFLRTLECQLYFLFGKILVQKDQVLRQVREHDTMIVHYSQSSTLLTKQNQRKERLFERFQIIYKCLKSSI